MEPVSPNKDYDSDFEMTEMPGTLGVYPEVEFPKFYEKYAGDLENNNRYPSDLPANVNCVGLSEEDKRYWGSMQHSMELFKTFNELSAWCKKQHLPPLPELTEAAHMRLTLDECDPIALTRMPAEELSNKQWFPIRCKSDGNCFYNAASRLVYGNQQHYNEMRIRVVKWMCANINTKLMSREFLSRGLEEDVEPITGSPNYTLQNILM